ncbi:hypothetical protein [Chitinophaga ginsengisoli]|uniref:Lipoprotein n=1 Tax=Chitinophaga ginsengisoli TaxID=363837 RepID=A0A2P8FW50_9BACT|nr:hypothetical protein [Chitinophaga ginsengisoli]PSL25865.1 hypothetical protein CLV42_11270 [Chitinophaga ginsengisoli]
MKRLILASLVLTLITSCASRSYLDTGRKKDYDPTWVYKVYKIDSIGSWNLIYVKHEAYRYKILSHKEIDAEGMKIGKHEKYNLKLHSMIYGAMFAYGVKCFNFDNTADVICLERNKGIFDLLYAENLKGLYLVEKLP